MRVFTLTLLTLAIAQVIYAQNTFQKDIATMVINFDPSYMQKFDYTTDTDYIVEESHTNYHIPIDGEKTLILKVLKSASPISNLTAQQPKILQRKDIKSLTKAFVSRVNTGATHVVLKIKTADGIKMYAADYTIFRVLNEEYMSYFAPPHFSFFYDLKSEYNPGQTVLNDDYQDNFATRFFFHGQTQVQGIENNVLLKMYNDACAKRPYGVTTPLSPKGENNLYKEAVSFKTGEKLYRSCQHPIQSEYLKGIGLYKEFYEEDGKVYSSNLTAIDGIPIQTYLKLVAPSLQSNEKRIEDASVMTEEPIRTAIPNDYDEEATIFGAGQAKGLEEKSKVQPLVQAFIKKPEAKAAQPTTTAVKIVQQGMIHTVEKGETLYRLAKQYNTTVEKLKDLNSLTGNTILVKQELLVRVSD